MSETILFDMYYGVGYTQSSLKLASLLREKGYKVVYVGLEEFCKPAIELGFDFIVHNPALFPIISVAEGQQIRTLFSESLSNIFSGERVAQSRQNISEFNRLIAGLKPCLAIVDEEHAYKYFFYQLAGVPTLSVQTMPDKSPEKLSPPFMSWYCPNSNRSLSIATVKLLWSYKLLKGWFRRRFYATIYFRQNTLSLVKKILAEYGTNLSKVVSFESSVQLCVKNEPLMILSAVDFDFPRAPRDHVYRIGPLKNMESRSTPTSSRFEALCKKLSDTKGKRPIIYCSLGTVTAYTQKKLTLFFTKMRKVAILNPDKEFVFSVSHNLAIDILHPVPDNVSVFSSLPQIKLLEYCDMMVTHGGMNSITECIFSEVPMLVYPQLPHSDQMGNSARVIFHGLGLRGKTEYDSVKRMSNKINQVLLNKPLYQSRLKQMKEKFIERNKSMEAIEIIETIINNHHHATPRPKSH